MSEIIWPFSSEDVYNYRNTYGCSIFEAKRKLQKRHVQSMLEGVKDSKDIEVLCHILDYIVEKLL